MKPYPIKKAFYKTKSALQLSLVFPKTSEDGKYLSKEGAMFLEIANAIGKKKYDWEHKFSIALTGAELSDIEFNRLTKKETKIYHDPFKGKSQEGKFSKNLTIVRRDSNDGYNLYGNQRVDGETVKYMFVLSDKEYHLFKTLTMAAVPAIYGWQ